MVARSPNYLSLSKILSSTLIIFILLTFTTCHSNSQDSSSLLAFKSKVDTSNFLTSWSNISDLCSSWLGVTCHPVTHRVIKIVLNDINLTGSIHDLIHLNHLRHLSLHHNLLTSSLPNFNSWPNLKHIYLSHNKFSGEFPRGISRLKRLRRLDLSYNELTGEIPLAELIQLPHLLTLLLEFNAFNGSLGTDATTTHVVMFSDFNVTYNDFTGKIPNWLSKFPVTSFTGNVKLCGYPLRSICPSERVTSDPTVMNTMTYNNQKKKSLSESMFFLIVTIDGVAVMMTVLAVTWCCYNKKRNKESEIDKVKYHQESSSSNYNLYNSFEYGVKNRTSDQFANMVCFEGCKGFNKVDDLLKASAEMLGKGSVGTSYKVAIDGGEFLVVKRVIEKLKKMKDVDGLLRLIGGLRHQNVVSLRAYYSSREELLLVYDFHTNGSLHNHLHGNRGPGRTPLDWTTRLKYAIGAAKGLAFLHSYNKTTKLCHGHLTPSNILIDHYGNACISDICLPLLLQLPISTPNNMANSQISAKHFSQKSDVYSFGVVLLEILTGKMASKNNDGGGDIKSLEKWVQRVVNNKEWTWDVFDFELARYKEMEDEMLALLKVAMACLASNPKDRPKMITVEKMIEDIRKKENRGRKIEFMIENSSNSSGTG